MCSYLITKQKATKSLRRLKYRLNKAYSSEIQWNEFYENCIKSYTFIFPHKSIDV